MKKNIIHIGFIIFGLFSFCITKAQQSPNKQRALEYIQTNAQEFNLIPYHNLKLRFVRNGLAGETLRFQHMVNEVPVFNSEIVINFNKNNQIAYQSSSYNTSITSINTNPTITENEAISITDRELNISGTVHFQQAKLYVVNLENKTQLVYRVITETKELSGCWEVLVDAQNGNVLRVQDIAIYKNQKQEIQNTTTQVDLQPKTFENKTTSALAFEPGVAMVFMSDPLSSAGVMYGGNYVDNDDADVTELNAERISVTLPEIENIMGTYKLKSSYVEIRELDPPYKGTFTQNSPNFDFTRSHDGFEAANAFYHIDNSMRYINETLGVSCTQNVASSHAGIIWYDPAGVNGQDNSYYTTGTGSLVFGEGCVDDAEDVDVVLHELMHGIHDWLTNGSSMTNDGLGEGSGDYWAQSYSRSLNQWMAADAQYHWMFNWDGHNTCWSGRTTNYNAIYPTGLVGSIHIDGQIWSTALMNIWNELGKAKTDTAFLEGLALTSNLTNQNTAAIAVRQAAINMGYSCADVNVITQKFTAAGYTMPALTLSMTCPENQTVVSDTSGNYILPNFDTLVSAITENCDATISQSPAIGSVVGIGTHTITMTATSGSSTVNCSFLLTVEDVMDTNNFELQNAITLYPNPATNQLTIKGQFKTINKFEIINTLGQKVHNGIITNEETTIDLSSLNSGIYFIKLEKNDKIYRFIKK